MRAATPAGLRPHLSITLTRVGGLAVDVLDGLMPTAAVDDVMVVDDELTTMAPGLIDVFFRLVPALDDDVPLRRRVLAAKRAVNRLAPLGLTDEQYGRIADRILPEERTALYRWTDATSRRKALIEKLAASLEVDRLGGVRSLAAALDSESFLGAVALAAPDWVRFGRIREFGAWTPRTVQTLYSYVTRASMKTSPFSGLTTVGAAGSTGQGRAVSRTSTTVAYLALLRLARDENTAPLLEYRLAPVRNGGDAEPNGVFLHSEFMVTQGTVWRQDRVIEADHAIRWVTRVPPDRRDRISHQELLTALGGERPRARFRRLLDSGVIQPVPPWSHSQPPLKVLAGLLNGPLAPELAADLELAHSMGAGVATESVAGRLEAAEVVKRLTRTLGDLDEAGQLPSGLIYEDRETDLALADPLGVPVVRGDLVEFGARIRPQIFRSHLYDVLLEHFVAEFGVGGVSDDPMAFLMRLTVERDSSPLMQWASEADLRSRQDPAERAWLPVGPSSAPPNVGVMFQLEADEQAALRAGRYRLVVNQFTTGTGGIFARFTRLLGADFRSGMEDYLQHCWPGEHRRQLTMWTDCNTVQAESAGVLPSLALPGEVSGPGALSLADVVLAHDSSSDTLSLLDRQGRAVGLAYLGLVPAHLMQSYARLLTVLADPWVNACLASDYTMAMASELEAAAGELVVELGRQARGRVVTRRRSWVVPVAQLPKLKAGADDAEGAVELARFRAAHDLPDEVFVHQLGGVSHPMSGVRKPMWTALTAPLSVEPMQQWIAQETTHLRFVEVLPARHANHQLDGAGRRRVTEHAVMLAWPREGGTR